MSVTGLVAIWVSPFSQPMTPLSLHVWISWALWPKLGEDGIGVFAKRAASTGLGLGPGEADKGGQPGMGAEGRVVDVGHEP